MHYTWITGLSYCGGTQIHTHIDLNQSLRIQCQVNSLNFVILAVLRRKLCIFRDAFCVSSITPQATQHNLCMIVWRAWVDGRHTLTVLTIRIFRCLAMLFMFICSVSNSFSVYYRLFALLDWSKINDFFHLFFVYGINSQHFCLM